MPKKLIPLNMDTLASQSVVKTVVVPSKTWNAQAAIVVDEN